MSPPRKVYRYSPQDLTVDRLTDTPDDDDELACPIHTQINPLSALEIEWNEWLARHDSHPPTIVNRSVPDEGMIDTLINPLTALDDVLNEWLARNEPNTPTIVNRGVPNACVIDGSLCDDGAVSIDEQLYIVEPPPDMTHDTPPDMTHDSPGIDEATNSMCVQRGSTPVQNASNGTQEGGGVLEQPSSSSATTTASAGGCVTGSLPIRDIPLFNAFELRQRVDFRDIRLQDIEMIPAMIRDAVGGAIDQAVNTAPRGSVLNVVLRGPSLASDVQAILRSDDAYNADLFLELISRVLQSNDDSLSDDSLDLIVTVARNRSGGVGERLKLGGVTYDEILSKKGRFLYHAGNLDNQLCFAMCIARYKYPQTSAVDRLTYATRIHQAAGFDINHPITLTDVGKFERLLGVKIIVFHNRVGCKRLECFQTQDTPHPQTVWLYLHNNHYYLIENKKGFFGARYICDYCYQTYSTILYHNCSQLCNVCFNIECRTRGEAKLKCGDCKRLCNSKFCFEQHKKPEMVHKYIPCKTLKHCDDCGTLYRLAKKPHTCAAQKCTHCGEPRLESVKEHNCFIQPVEKKVAQTNYILFDFETRFHGGKHEANFVCAMEMSGDRFCFTTLKCVGAFVRRYRMPKYRGYTFIAHNASGFDNYILLEYFVKQGITPSVTMRGSRVILMFDQAYQQRWIDSFSFLPMRLSRTPEALGFVDLAKGHFPHRFNTREHENYVGKYPEPSDYGYNEMIDSDKATFMIWYNSVCGGTFDFQVEIARYCVNDVELLRRACTTYRSSFMQCTELDPFSYTTLASACMGVFKTLFLPRDTVALTYDGAYTTQNKTFSDASIQWLEYLSLSNNCDIKHALNHGEQAFDPFYVDGYNAEERMCYEFAGCFYHGCVKCHVQGDVNPVTKVTYGRMYNAFKDKVQSLQRHHGVRVTVIWECEWASLKRHNASVKAFMATYKKPERLNPREALFGGRTNAMKLYHKVSAENDEKIRYYDFTSLYPMVQSTKPYPVGHPMIIFKNFDSIDNYFGFVKCVVLPPRGLFHPVLPHRCHGKLMFPLCRTCAEDLNQSTACTHSDVERQLSGVWVSLELQKALEKGYLIVHIDEVWHFPTKTDTLFRGYVNTFLKCKQEASGYPGHVKTDVEKAKYVADYFEKEGIQLDPAKICVNKAMRSCNKLLLNSLWGRFSMRNNMPSCELITDPTRFTQLMFSDQFDVRQFCFISDDVALVQWRHADSRGSRIKDVNVFIGAMTTAHARLMLYDVLDTLQERVLYCDTDSIVFTSGAGDLVPPLGPYLGDLTDELNSGDVCGSPEEDYITEFVSGGPKCYAYTTKQGKTTVKCKGVSLTAQNAAVVTPASLIGMVHAFVANQQAPAPPLMTATDTIKRDKRHFHLRNETVFKKVRVVYNKRRVMPDYTTLPYGY